MTKRPLSVNISLLFIVIDALIWLTLCLFIILNIHPALPGEPLIRLIYAGMSLAFAAVLSGLAFFLYRHRTKAYYLVCAILLFTILITFFDNVGLSDLLVVLLNLIPLVLLIKDRKWYLQNPAPAATSG